MDYYFITTVFTTFMATVLGVSSTDPPGHMKPLGSHREPLGGIEELTDFPSPSTFFEKYVKQSKPFIMRKVLENGDIPAYHKWNDEYLSKVYGDIPVDVETGKLENREADGMKDMDMREYIERYNDLDGYLVTDVPKPMRADVNLPRSLRCGGFQDNLVSVIMWFSSGGTKSHLHNDGLDNINCLLDGRKDLFMADKKHKDLVEADLWKFDGAFSRVHVEQVDMYKFPKLQNLPWYNVTIHKGDCLFIPLHWYHHVDSSKGRNLALNFWFNHMFWHNKTECEDNKQEKKNAFPLSNYNIQGDMDTATKTIVFERFENAGKEFVSYEDFHALVTSNEKDEKDNGDDNEQDEDKVKEKRCWKCFEELDQDKDGVLSWQEIQTTNIDKVIDKYPKVFKNIYEEIYGSDDSQDTEPTEEINENGDEDTPSETDQGVEHEEL